MPLCRALPSWVHQPLSAYPKRGPTLCRFPADIALTGFSVSLGDYRLAPREGRTRFRIGTYRTHLLASPSSVPVEIVQRRCVADSGLAVSRLAEFRLLCQGICFSPGLGCLAAERSQRRVIS